MVTGFIKFLGIVGMVGVGCLPFLLYYVLSTVEPEEVDEE